MMYKLKGFRYNVLLKITRGNEMKKWISGLALFASLFSSQLLLAEEALPPSRDGSIWQTVVMIGIAMLFFYFILWRPEQKRRKALEDQRSALKKGDRVTAMGILGSVVRVQDQTVILKMYDGSKIEVLKGAITDVAPGSEAEGEEKGEQ
jgi:preprotein translocase subunit YajC